MKFADLYIIRFHTGFFGGGWKSTNGKGKYACTHKLTSVCHLGVLGIFRSSQIASDVIWG